MGRCSLLGDAAHPMLPFLAQGACQAIEDGYVAAALLAGSAGDWPAALKEYERVRLPRTSRIQLGARARVVSMHEPSALGRMIRNLNYWIDSLTGRDTKRFKPDWIYQVNVVSEFGGRG
jgi:salicylate hydroxylase